MGEVEKILIMANVRNTKEALDDILYLLGKIGKMKGKIPDKDISEIKEKLTKIRVALGASPLIF